MTVRGVQKVRELRADVGLAERRKIDASLVDRLDGDIVRLDQQMRCVAVEFRACYGRWNAEPAAEDMLPHALIEDMAIARKYRIAAAVALLTEMSLAAWIFWQRELHPAAGAALAFSATTLIKWAIHLLAYGPGNHRRPRLVIQNLQRFVMWPSVAVFMVAFISMIVARIVEGPLAATDGMLRAVSMGMVLLAISLVFLSATLATVSFICSWSGRLADRHHYLDADSRSSRAFLAEVRREMSPSGAVGVTTVTELRQETAGQSRATVASIARAGTAGALLLFLLSIGSTACTSEAASQSTPIAVAMSSTHPSCNAVVDTSGSVLNLGLVWTQVRREMPDLVIRRDCAALRVFTFDVDGWSWKPLVEITIPAVKRPVAAQVPAELGGAKNFRDALEAKQRALLTMAEGEHRELVVGLLRKLDIVDEYLKTVTSTCCSDPVGVLRRIARTPNTKDVFVVVTDMADTRLGHRYAALSAASTDVRVLVLLAPANVRDAAYTGAPTGAADQYENRVRLLRAIAPWASVEPYFATGYADLLDSRSSATGISQ